MEMEREREREECNGDRTAEGERGGRGGGVGKKGRKKEAEVSNSYEARL